MRVEDEVAVVSYKRLNGERSSPGTRAAAMAH
jgi:hypothetical protein